MVTFAKGGTPVKRVGSLVPVLREAASFCARTVPATIRFEETFPEDLWLVELDSAQMSQVFHNLLLNAAQAMPRRGAVRVDAGNVELPVGSGSPLSPGRYVRVRVIDEGSGVDPKVMDRIFDPYFTTKSSGTGLGLAMAHSIVTRHGGHVSVESVAGEGASFEVLLPASQVPGAARDVVPAVSARRARVLLMDDDEDVRRMARWVLESLELEVVEVPDGAASANEYEKALRSGEPFGVVVLDLQVRGGVGGVEALERIRAIDPEVRAIVMSGYSDDPVMADCRQFGFAEAVAKPFTAEEMGEALNRALGRG